MKKFIVSLMVVCLLSMPVSVCNICYAEGKFNIDDYTADELAEIYSIISDKLFDAVAVPQGYYIVGVDLPEGKYNILKNSEFSEESNDFSWVAVFNNIDDYNNETSYYAWDSEDSKCVSACNTLWGGMNCELKEGMVLAVGFGKAGVRKQAEGLFNAFW